MAMIAGPQTLVVAMPKASGAELEQNPSNSAQGEILHGGIFFIKTPLGGRAIGYIYSDSAVAAPICAKLRVFCS
jgi:hypothetical protein